MQRYLFALALAGLVDSISYMVVGPSIVFYVLENGGTKEQYGFILSAFSFASFCTKPFLGWWSDERGFRTPYLSSLAIAASGGLLYLFSSALPPGRPAVAAILVSRLLGGIGAANSALGFAYVAKVVDHGRQTSTNTLLSAVRMTGMAAGPGVNALLGWVDVEVWGGRWTIDSLNSVGIVLVATNLLAMAFVWAWLDEPQNEAGTADAPAGGDEEKEKADKSDTAKQEENVTPSTRADFLKAIASTDVLVSFLSIFTFNANFQLIETGFPPAANDGLGWGPVETSVVLGSMSVVIVFMMVTVSFLSSKVGVSDAALVASGHACSAVAYSGLYLLWKRDARAWHFWLPIMLCASVFPIMAAPTRSFFTLAVDRKPAFKHLGGRMQAYLSMGASVAGFVTPGLVARFCLRTPEEVEASRDGRELTPWSLVAPAMSVLTCAGVAYIRATGGAPPTKSEELATGETAVDDEEGGIVMRIASAEECQRGIDGESATEASALLGGQTSKPRRCSGRRRSSFDKFDPKIAAHRSSACCIMGLSQGTSMHEEVHEEEAQIEQVEYN